MSEKIARGWPLLLVAFLALSLIAAGQAQESSEEKEQPASLAKEKPEVAEVTVTGKNFCIGCTLKKKLGAASQCSTYGHRHGLKVKKATGAEGKDIKKMAGKVLHYLDNDKSAELVKSHHGDTVEIKGKVYRMGNVLEVGSFKVTEAKPAGEGSEAKEEESKPKAGG
jgi:hypothetical protein